MDRALSCLLIALACLMIRPDQALAARGKVQYNHFRITSVDSRRMYTCFVDCLQCWRDVCVDGSFSADNSFSDCCGCIASAVNALHTDCKQCSWFSGVLYYGRD